MYALRQNVLDVWGSSFLVELLLKTYFDIQGK